MSKVGKKPINTAQNVKITVEGRTLKVAGPKGELEIMIPEGLDLVTADNKIQVLAKGGVGRDIMLGTFRSLAANMVHGVTEGWSKTLELVGTGYRAETNGKSLTLTIGYSHPVKFEAPEGINFKVEKTNITIEGPDKILVGQIAAKVRGARPPEPYKGKGVKHIDEIIRRKAGKAAKTATA